jgi:uncharacterized protein YaaQ
MEAILMKFIVAIVQDRDWAELRDSLIESGFRLTRLSSSGGFLRTGNTTFFTGVEDDKLDQLLEVIRTACKSREEYVSLPGVDPGLTTVVPVNVGGATVFVLDVDRFERV